MGFLSHIDNHIIALVVGTLMLFGSFATINSRSASKFDHDFALILLITGIVSFGFGFKLIDFSQVKELWP
ncbi:hypothetical protein RKD55_004597 [Rossellomorea marisflavi]